MSGSDSYGFKTYMNCWVYSLGLYRPGVTPAEWVCIGSSTVPIRGGRADSHFTREEVSVGFQCHTGVTPATTLRNPCPPHPASLITSIHYVPVYTPLLFPPPLISSYHHGPVRSKTIRTLFHCCKCYLSYTLMLFTDGPLFATLLKKTPAHISCFLIFTMC